MPSSGMHVAENSDIIKQPIWKRSLVNADNF